MWRHVTWSCTGLTALIYVSQLPLSLCVNIHLAIFQEVHCADVPNLSNWQLVLEPVVDFFDENQCQKHLRSYVYVI